MGVTIGVKDQTALAQAVLVVAPPGVEIHAVAGGRPVPALVFASIREMDLWRSRFAEQTGLAPFVEEALAELGVTVVAAPLAAALATVAQAPVVPHLKRIVAACSSRRTFFRLWSAAIPESPSRFLRRVRVLHARSLVAGGLSDDDAARMAGFRDADELSRASASCG